MKTSGGQCCLQQEHNTTSFIAAVWTSTSCQMLGGRRVVVFIFLFCSLRFSLSSRKHTLADLAHGMCVCFDMHFVVSGSHLKRKAISLFLHPLSIIAENLNVSYAKAYGILKERHHSLLNLKEPEGRTFETQKKIVSVSCFFVRGLAL